MRLRGRRGREDSDGAEAENEGEDERGVVVNTEECVDNDMIERKEHLCMVIERGRILSSIGSSVAESAESD